MATVLDTLVVKLAGDAADFDKTISSAKSRLDGFGSSAKAVGDKMTAAVTAPLLALGAVALKVSTDFNGAMANVASLGLAPERVQELKGEVQSLAIETGKATGDMADGLYQVVSAFGDSSESMGILEINAKAAAAGIATTTDAINLTSAVTKGYGDTSARAVQKVADLAFQTVKLGQTTFPELAASMGQVTPIAAGLGVTQETLFAQMATLTGVTGSAAEVSTQLRATYQALLKPTGEMGEAINAVADEIGLQGEATGMAIVEAVGFDEALQMLTAQAGGNSEQLGKMFGSVEAITAVMALSGGQADTYQEKLAAMGDVAGAADEAFAAQTEGINETGFTMQQAAVKAQVLAQKLGDGLAPSIGVIIDKAEPLIDRIISMADWFASADSDTQTWILTLGGLVAAAGPVIAIIGTLATAISGTATAVGVVIPLLGGGAAALGGVIAALTGPIGITVLAVAGMAAAWKADFLGIQTKTRTAAQWISNRWSRLTTNIPSWTSTAGTRAKTAWQSMMQGFRNKTQQGFPGIKSTFEAGLRGLKGAVDAHNWLIKSAFDAQVGLIDQVFSLFGWGNVGSEIVNGIANGIRNGASSISNAARSAAQSALNAAKRFLGIRSPSKEAAMRIGIPFAEGIAEGANRGLANMASNINTGLNNMIGGVQPAAGGNSFGGSIHVENYFYGQQDQAAVERGTEMGIRRGLRQLGMA